MTNLEYLKHWIEINKLSLKSQTIDKVFEIEGFGLCYLLEEKEVTVKKDSKEEKINRLFDEEFELEISANERRYIVDNNIDYYVYNFGGNFFYTKVDEIKKPKLRLFKYVGKCVDSSELGFSFLGIHGKYEILSGSRKYEMWCEKAKFLNINKLGICEKNTLAGLMQFQSSCDKAGIKSILGETISIKTKEEEIFEGKVYIKNEDGWRNILYINKEINVINVEENFIEEEKLLTFGKGLSFVFTEVIQLSIPNIQKYTHSFEDIYFQIDSVIWDSDKTDETYLLNLQNYISNFKTLIKPILINDAYYLDEEDNHIREFLLKLKGVGHHKSSSNQYFKNLEDNLKILSPLFGTDDKGDNLFEEIIFAANENSQLLAENSNFKIETKEFKLPKFEIKDIDEKYLSFTNNELLFQFLIEENFKEKSINFDEKTIKIWRDRIDVELDLIHRGNYFDYFLILWDIVNWCNKNNILVGVGRGSAGGSLISYLLGITRVNPIEFNLLFFRFLSEGRLGKSLPDIDLDFENREAVIGYMKQRYGENYVCSVGAYTAFQLKQALKDLAKQKGISYGIVNILSKLIRVDDGEWDDLFLTAAKTSIWKDFIIKHGDVINDILLILHQPKAKSIHACATLILPRTNIKGEEVDIFEQIPVRKEGDLLVSEWEGDELADAKYLKEDILGLKQLEKFKNILNLIKETKGEDIDIYNLPLNDKNIYDRLFKFGYNSDVFHFNSILLKAYSQEVRPEDIEDLIAMLALVRPGAVKSGANIDYVKFKLGKKEPIYDYGIKEVTENTYGLLIYQEQIMQICQILGGFSGSEAEDVRKSMGKLKRELIEPYEKRFIEGAVKNNCSPEEAKKIWEKMVGFAEYGFNRSHSACYAITGYISQWLKYYYPIQFWTTAFEFADNDDKIMSYISEIKKTDSFIQIIPPDINNSQEKFFTDYSQGKIYWSLSKIDSLGPVAVKAIINERNKNGAYFSLEEFFKRVKKAEVNKRNIEHLILAGSFDDIEKISNPIDRIELIFKFYDIAGIKEKEYNLMFIEEGINKEYWWTLRQKEVSGLGYFDYKKIIQESAISHLTRLYCDEISFFNTYSEGKKVMVGGIVVAVEEKGSKNGKFGQIYIDANDEQIIINYWSKLWGRDSKLFNTESIGKILLISGRVNYNSYSKFNTLQIEDTSELLFLS